MRQEIPLRFPEVIEKHPAGQNASGFFLDLEGFEGKHSETVSEDLPASLELPFPGIDLGYERTGICVKQGFKPRRF